MPSEPRTRLPWPEGFGTPPRNLMLVGTVFFTLVAVAFALRLLDAVASENPTGAAFGAAGVAIGIAFAVLCANLIVVRRSTIPRSRSGSGGTSDPGLTLPTDRKLIAVSTAWVAAIAVFLCSYSAYLAFGSNRSGITVALATVTGLVTVAAITLLIALIRAAGRRKYLQLTETGISLDNGMLHQIIDWRDIEDVAATTNPRFPMISIRPKNDQGLRTVRASRMVSIPGNQRFLREMVFGPQAFKIDPALLYYTVRFYWQHPEARHELTSDAVTNRMQRGDLTS
ncbi:hypothetical protein [Nocardia wallacei]|uniref:hypothetical protein n=1 Tax=Nocardia wallacei TaxID=480035 RepID=UPI0024559FCE|nr:hypothetical protein [Nocardia wallacei]